jgi:hypothetical protein
LEQLVVKSLGAYFDLKRTRQPIEEVLRRRRLLTGHAGAFNRTHHRRSPGLPAVSFHGTKVGAANARPARAA